jgi:hypothetical protein
MDRNALRRRRELKENKGKREESGTGNEEIEEDVEGSRVVEFLKKKKKKERKTNVP